MTAIRDPDAIAREAATPESVFMARVIDLAKRLGYSVYHTFDSRRSEAGFPDLVLVRPPRLLFIECKVGKRQLTPEQRDWLTRLDGCDEVEAFTLRDDSGGWGDGSDLVALLSPLSLRPLVERRG